MVYNLNVLRPVLFWRKYWVWSCEGDDMLCLRVCIVAPTEKEAFVCACVRMSETSCWRRGCGMGLTGKLCLVFMAFCMQLSYLKDRAPVKVPDYKPGISQPPDYYEDVTHHLMFTYSLLELSKESIHCTIILWIWYTSMHLMNQFKKLVVTTKTLLIKSCTISPVLLLQADVHI